MRRHPLKFGLLLFWSLWFSLVFASNLGDLLRHFNLVSSHYLFVSGNLALVTKVLSIYHLPTVITLNVFMLVLFLEGTAALLFICSTVIYYKQSSLSRSCLWAFVVSLGLWGLFMLGEELFLAYQFEPTHIRMALLELASLLTIYLLD